MIYNSLKVTFVVHFFHSALKVHVENFSIHKTVRLVSFCPVLENGLTTDPNGNAGNLSRLEVEKLVDKKICALNQT